MGFQVDRLSENNLQREAKKCKHLSDSWSLTQDTEMNIKNYRAIPLRSW